MLYTLQTRTCLKLATLGCPIYGQTWSTIHRTIHQVLGLTQISHDIPIIFPCVGAESAISTLKINGWTPIIEVAQVQQSRPERIKCWLAWSPNRWVTKTNTFCWLKWNFYWFDVVPCCIVLPASRMNSSHVILTMKPTVNLAINPICEQAGALPCTNLIVV